MSQNFLYTIDIYGMSAQLNIFNNHNKTIPGLILSFIFISLSIAYGLYALINYFKFLNPSVIYFRENEKETNRTIDMTDPLLFGFYDISSITLLNESDITLMVSYYIHNKDVSYSVPLNIENCKYGKNIDMKYKEKLPEMQSIEGMFCIADNLTDYPIYYSSKDEYNLITLYIQINENSSYAHKKLLLGIVNSNSAINHLKRYPLTDNYFSSTYVELNRNEFSRITYNFQYIKYESDRGMFFGKKHIYNGKTFSNLEILKTNYKDEYGFIAVMNIGVNQLNFDYYNRVYERFQLVLIEIYWYVDIILLIGRLISKIFIDKETSIKMVKYLLTKNTIEKSPYDEISINNNNSQQKESVFKESVNIGNNSQQNKPIFKEKINIKNDKNIFLDKKIKQPDFKSKISEIYETNYDLNLDSDISSGEKSDEKTINVLNSLNYYHILKSHFCFKDDKTKLIDCSHNLIKDEVLIEKILRRMNDMEEQINFILNSLKPNATHRIDKFDEINELIDKIDKKSTQKY